MVISNLHKFRPNPLVMDLVASVLTISITTNKSSDIAYIIRLKNIHTFKMLEYRK